MPERVGEPRTPDSPKESFQLTLPWSGAKWQGGGRKAGHVTAPHPLNYTTNFLRGWRVPCRPPPERSGLGALVVLLALVWWRAFEGVGRCSFFLSSSGGEADFIWLAAFVWAEAAGAVRG